MHALLSVHVVPLATGVPLHVPVAGSHVWALRHWVAPGQVTGLPPVQTPPWQVSVCVHPLLSLHVVPFRAVVLFTQPVAGLQLSAVHGLLSSHEMLALEQLPPAQIPSVTWHLSAVMQATPSAFWQVPVALHALHAPQPPTGLLQQNPSVHERPLWHWSLVAHCAPAAFLPHRFPMHVLFMTQSAFVAQVWLHALFGPSHRNVPHEVIVPPTSQLPAPSHVFASVTIDAPAGQDGGTHCVPAVHF